MRIRQNPTVLPDPKNQVAGGMYKALREGLGDSVLTGISDPRVQELKDRYLGGTPTDSRDDVDVLGAGWQRVPDTPEPTFEVKSNVDSDSQRLQIDRMQNRILLTTINMTLTTPLSGFMRLENLLWNQDANAVSRSYTNGSFSTKRNS